MKREQATGTVVQAIADALEGGGEATTEIPEDMRLIGGESSLDSMKLVEVCLALEDAADAQGFEFDWTSEAALSTSRSMFRTVATLAQAFHDQSMRA